MHHVVFVVYPFVVSIYYSMTEWDGAQPSGEGRADGR